MLKDSLTLDYTTNLQSWKQFGTGTETEIYVKWSSTESSQVKSQNQSMAKEARIYNVEKTFFTINNCLEFWQRRQWQPTPVLLPGKSHGQSLVGCSNEVAKCQTRLRDFTFTFHFHALEKEMQPTPVFLPGESQGEGSLVSCHLWGHTESDTTEVT